MLLLSLNSYFQRKVDVIVFNIALQYVTVYLVLIRYQLLLLTAGDFTDDENKTEPE